MNEWGISVQPKQTIPKILGVQRSKIKVNPSIPFLKEWYHRNLAQTSVSVPSRYRFNMCLTCPYYWYAGQKVLPNSLQVWRLGYTGRTQRTTVLYSERERPRLKTACMKYPSNLIKEHVQSYLLDKRGRRVVPPRTDRPHWLLWPEHVRRKRMLHRRPDTWSDQCHQTEWQTPDNPSLIPRKRDTSSSMRETKVNFSVMYFLSVCYILYLSQLAFE